MAQFCIHCGHRIESLITQSCPVCGTRIPISGISVNIGKDVHDSQVIVGGTVKLTEAASANCPDCFGTGKEHMLCPWCKGEGQLSYYSGPKNDRRPEGWLDALLLMLKQHVDYSQSTNHSFKSCEKCSGRGRVQLADPDNISSYMDALVQNRPSGKKYNNHCPTCKGTGRVRLPD